MLHLKIVYSLAIFFSLLFVASAAVFADTGRAGFVWQYADPESQGLSVNGLESTWNILEKRNTRALLVIRNDFIVFERYANGYNKDRRHYTASLAKSLVGGMSLLVALNDGLIKIDEFASKYIPSWRNHPLKSKITIRHLATHTSGLEDAESPGKSHNELSGWKKNFWKRVPDPFTIARDQRGYCPTRHRWRDRQRRSVRPGPRSRSPVPRSQRPGRSFRRKSRPNPCPPKGSHR